MDNKVSVLNGNIAFAINMPISKISSVMLSEGMEIEIFTQMIVRENDISLWGFLDLNSHKMFDTLLGVSGVGPKTAQIMIYEVGVDLIVKAILMGDPSKLKVSGVGMKTAEKIILELRNKVGDKFQSSGVSNQMQEQKPTFTKNVSEAIDGLITLGYKEKDIMDVLKVSDMSESDSVQDIIKQLLKKL
ncbi:MAG: Holliday junction branch migration protein RuvA [Candidatus Dojkabacteria bacterium]